jgi:hypothetical protein
MEKGHYPDYAVKILKEASEHLDSQFSRVWGALSPSVERDTVMYHLFAAKKQLNAILEVNKNG